MSFKKILSPFLTSALLGAIIAPISLGAETAQERRARLEQELAKIEADIAANRVTLQETQTQRTSLERDIAILDNSSFAVRSERQGGGNGRVYTVHFEVSDTSGNAAVASCRFEVPHNHKRPAVDDGPGGGYTVTP